MNTISKVAKWSANQEKNWPLYIGCEIVASNPLQEVRRAARL
jgi:hypothetical protein